MLSVSSPIGSNRKTLVLRWAIVVGGGLPVERQASSGALTVYERITDAFMAVITWPPPHSYGYITRSHNPLRSKQIVKLSFGFTDLAQYMESNTETSHSAMITSSLPRFQSYQWRCDWDIVWDWRYTRRESHSRNCQLRKLTISVHFKQLKNRRK